MEDNKNHFNEIDALLKGIFRDLNLRELFQKRVHDLGLSERGVRQMLKIEYRALRGILDGKQKKTDISSFQKLAMFLNMPVDELIEIHSRGVEKNFSNENTVSNRKKFIKENFDLAVLRKAGFINDITDFPEIEKRIVDFFGFTTIFEYRKRAFGIAFSSGIVTEKSTIKTSISRDFWLTSVKILAVKIENPYLYDREGLVKFFPQIKWYSTNEEFGLINVIKSLFKLGITVIFQPRISTIHLRGATFSVNNNPVIALTDYKGFYPTLWHCLIHELFHVLFDWDDISKNIYSFHISDDSEELLTVSKRENEADDFARKYLCSKEKMKELLPFMNNQRIVNEFAKKNNIHPSIIHIYNAYDNSKTDRMVWVRAKRYMPDIRKCVFRLSSSWEDSKSIDEKSKKLKVEIYN